MRNKRSLLLPQGSGVVPSLLRLAIIIFSSVINEAVSEVFSFSFKRVFIISTLASFLFFITLWNHIGYCLDDILFPGWRLVKIERPTFIIGNARSGTTLLHKMLALNSNYTSFRTWEILFGQSVTLHRLIIFLFNVDIYLGGYVSKLVGMLESVTWGRARIHSIGLNEFEEDEWLLATQGLSQLLLLLFPLAMNVLGPLIYFDEMNPEAKAEVFQFYRDCVQRHLYARGGTHFLSKNPTFTLRIASIFEYFPDANIICSVRDPADAVPSMVSYIGRAWHLFSSPNIEYPQVNQLVEFCFAHYLYPLGNFVPLLNFVNELIAFHRSSAGIKASPVSMAVCSVFGFSRQPRCNCRSSSAPFTNRCI